MSPSSSSSSSSISKEDLDKVTDLGAKQLLLEMPAPTGQEGGDVDAKKPRELDYRLGFYDYPQYTAQEYYDRSCFSRMALASSVGLGFGLLYGFADLSWYRPDAFLFEHKGVKVVDTARIKNYFGWTGSYLLRPMATAAVISATYAGVECLVEGLRGDHTESSPWWDSAAGGLVSGAMIGIMKGKRLDIMTVASVGVAGIMAACRFASHHYAHYHDHQIHALEHRHSDPARFATAESMVSVASLKKIYPEYKDI